MMKRRGFTLIELPPPGVRDRRLSGLVGAEDRPQRDLHAAVAPEFQHARPLDARRRRSCRGLAGLDTAVQGLLTSIPCSSAVEKSSELSVLGSQSKICRNR